MTAIPPGLDQVRRELDLVDERIADLLVARFRRLDRVGSIKAREGSASHDPAREAAVLEHVRARISRQPRETIDAVVAVFERVLEQGRYTVKRAMARHDPAGGKAREEEATDAARADAPNGHSSR